MGLGDTLYGLCPNLDVNQYTTRREVLPVWTFQLGHFDTSRVKFNFFLLNYGENLETVGGKWDHLLLKFSSPSTH